MRIALAQLNSTVGDFESNIKKMVSFIQKARGSKADLLVFPNSALTGYPLYDLPDRPDFAQACRNALKEFLPYTSGIIVVLGINSPIYEVDEAQKRALLMEDGKITGQTDHLGIMHFNSINIGILLDDEIHRTTGTGTKPNLYISLASYPYCFSGLKNRIRFLSDSTVNLGAPLLAVNQIGGNGEIIFDGSSMVFDKAGNLIILGKHFEEEMLIFDTDINYHPISAPEEDISWLYRALILGFRDYFYKTGFKKAILGLSGGIDSALVACIAVDALGKENVLGVSMPSRYSSDHSKKDAERLAKNLGIEYRVLPIEDVFASYIKLLNGSEETIGDLAEENIQARIRGNLLMFISNREGYMLVNTSNKSESAVGYSTMYGDMCGSLAPIADVSKTMVYKLCEYINHERDRIPNSIITKPPSAELRPGQLDQDSLPDYDVLDAIIDMYVEKKMSADQIVKKGYHKDLVLRILNLIDRMEYKRRQAPPPLKITAHTLGIDVKLPVIQRFNRK